MPFVGMDVEVVTKVSADLKVQADTLDGIVATVDKLVSRAKGTWRGRDAERLLSLWQGSARSVLTNLSADVAGLADKAKSNALEQTRASENFVSDGGVWSLGSILHTTGTAWARVYDVLDKGITYGGAADTFGMLVSTGVTYSKGILTLDTSARAGMGLFDEMVGKVKLVGPLEKVLGPVGVGFGAIDSIRDFSKDDYVASGLDAAGMALGIVALATPVGWGVLAGGAAVAGASLVWGALPSGFKDSVNGTISTAAKDVGHLVATEAKGVWNAQVAEVKGAVHMATDVVNAEAKAVEAVANEGSRVLKSILKKPSWVPW